MRLHKYSCYKISRIIVLIPMQNKAILLPPCTKGERRYSSYSFLTSVLDGGEWLVSHSGHSLPLGKDSWYPLDRRLAGLDTRLEEKSFASVRN
jgi:hypothetical protein